RPSPGRRSARKAAAAPRRRRARRGRGATPRPTCPAPRQERSSTRWRHSPSRSPAQSVTPARPRRMCGYTFHVRRFALAAVLLAPFDWSGQVVVLGRDLQSADPERRREAVQKLADMSDPGAKPLLLSALSDVDSLVRIEAARVLARRRAADAVAP